MGTHSCILHRTKEGAVQGIYCHWDGYPSYNGRILRDFYKDADKVFQLIQLGDLSSLGEEIGEKHDFNSSTGGKVCTAYGRDRGEEDTEAKTFATLDEALNHFDVVSYSYLYEKGEWFLVEFKCALIPLAGMKLNEGG